MDLFKIVSFTQRHRKAFKIFDWLCALAAIGYGIYVMSWLWIISGILIFLIIWWDPAAKIPNYIRSRIVSKPKG